MFILKRSASTYEQVILGKHPEISDTRQLFKIAQDNQQPAPRGKDAECPRSPSESHDTRSANSVGSTGTWRSAHRLLHSVRFSLK